MSGKALININTTRGGGLKRTTSGIKRVNSISQRVEYFEKKLEETEKENTEIKHTPPKRRKLNNEEPFRLQVEELQDKLTEEQALLQSVRQERVALQLEHSLALNKISELEQQLQAEFAKRVVETDHGQQEVLALREQIEDLKFGVRLSNALAKLNKCIDQAKLNELEVNKEAVGWLSRDLANLQSELRQSQREVENARVEIAAVRKAVDDKLQELSQFRSDNTSLKVKAQSQNEAIEHLQKALEIERKLNHKLLAAAKQSFKHQEDPTDKMAIDTIQSLNTQVETRGKIITKQELEIKLLKKQLAQAQAKAKASQAVAAASAMATPSYMPKVPHMSLPFATPSSNLSNTPPPSFAQLSMALNAGPKASPKPSQQDESSSESDSEESASDKPTEAAVKAQDPTPTKVPLKRKISPLSIASTLLDKAAASGSGMLKKVQSFSPKLGGKTQATAVQRANTGAAKPAIKFDGAKKPARASSRVLNVNNRATKK